MLLRRGGLFVNAAALLLLLWWSSLVSGHQPATNVAVAATSTRGEEAPRWVQAFCDRHGLSREAKNQLLREIDIHEEEAEQTTKGREQQTGSEDVVLDRADDENEVALHRTKEKSEDPEFSLADLAFASMLLGAVVFVMSLFSLVNLEDKDMQFYSWSVISATISIFVAVLAFQSINTAIHFGLLRHFAKFWHTIADLGQMMMYFCFLQVSIAYLSGSLYDRPFRKDCTIFNDKDCEVNMTITDQKTLAKLKTKCWGTIFSHMTGFAAINFGGELQHQDVALENRAIMFSVVPFMFVSQLFVCRVLRLCRHYYIERKFPDYEHGIEYRGWDFGGSVACSTSTGMERMETEDEEFVARNHALAMWDEQVLDCEGDIAGLLVSFLFVQACRFNISGVMPDNFGIEKENYLHSGDCTVRLLLLSVALVGCTILLVTLRTHLPKHPRADSLPALFVRIVASLQNAAAMSFAWCLLYSTKWEITRLLPGLGPPFCITSRIVLALGISFFAFVMIFFLDKLADSPMTGEHADMVIFTIIGAIGILVGFSWEQAFDGGVEVIAQFSPQPVVMENALTILVFVVVIVPWRRHILTKVIKLEEARMEDEEEDYTSRSASKETIIQALLEKRDAIDAKIDTWHADNSESPGRAVDVARRNGKGADKAALPSADTALDKQHLQRHVRTISMHYM